MKALITQSNYIPWKGYFDNIAEADVFVVYDDVQYTRRDWRNRNIIKTPQGAKWLTIPVEVKGNYLQKINEINIADLNWRHKHLGILKQHYAKADCYKNTIKWVENVYETATYNKLSSINVHFLKEISAFLGIQTKFIDSKEFDLVGNPTEKLANICDALGATTYITGPAAKAYLNEDIFAERNINIQYSDYSNYPAYPQLFPPFEHGVSIFDLILNCGTDSAKFMKHVQGKAKMPSITQI